ncbi:MAG: response regulator [Elusimicrobia bacterium]|nr:response regulator [Elusimicrobiota bacterium]
MDGARGRTKILVVDDDPHLRSHVRAIFTEDPYDFLEASDGHIGLASALSHVPQLIVVDMRMPRMNGLEFIKSARANPNIRHIPIVVATAKLSSPEGLDCLRAGASAYVPKPLQPVAFRRRVKALLGHH